jgi:beta-glucosidase
VSLDLGACNSSSPLLACFLINLQNTGHREGAEVIQMYINFPIEADEPKVLRGFQKLYLLPQQQANVTFSLNKEDLSIWENEHWKLVTGTFTAAFGSSSMDTSLLVQFTI